MGAIVTPAGRPRERRHNELPLEHVQLSENPRRRIGLGTRREVRPTRDARGV
jgi:hypothetical protein